MLYESLVHRVWSSSPHGLMLCEAPVQGLMLYGVWSTGSGALWSSGPQGLELWSTGSGALWSSGPQGLVLYGALVHRVWCSMELWSTGSGAL